jgi:hypothetical protein
VADSYAHPDGSLIETSITYKAIVGDNLNVTADGRRAQILASENFAWLDIPLDLGKLGVLYLTLPLDELLAWAAAVASHREVTNG